MSGAVEPPTGMRRREGLLLAGTVGVALLAGCAAPREGGEPTDRTTTRFVGRVLTVSEANGTSVADAPPARTAHFADLSDAQREEFERALEGDVREPSS